MIFEVSEFLLELSHTESASRGDMWHMTTLNILLQSWPDQSAHAFQETLLFYHLRFFVFALRNHAGIRQQYISKPSNFVLFCLSKQNINAMHQRVNPQPYFTFFQSKFA